MAITEIGRITGFADTQTNVEDNDGTLVEIRFGVDTDTGNLGFTTDAGETWNWIVPGTPFSFAVSDTASIDLTWSSGVLSASVKTHYEPITFNDEIIIFNHDVLMMEVAN